MKFPKDIPFSDDQYRSVVGILRRKTGVDLHGYREGVARRRIAKRVRASGCRTMDLYINRLATGGDEAEELVRLITIQVSHFFRNPEVFNLLAHSVLPEVFAWKRKGEPVRIWSAACADGEEAYSMAILLLNFHGARLADHDVKVIGTDVSPGSIEKSVAGKYDESRLELVDENLKRRYFRKTGKTFEVRSVVKALTQFRIENLFTGKGVADADIILLRNMLIYFDRERQDELMNKVVPLLSKRGYLVLGKSETLPATARGILNPIAARERIYTRG